MASYPVHLGTATVLGAGYGVAGVVLGDLDWGQVFLGAGLAALGGVLPDLDSDSGIPVRELFGLAAAVCPLLLFPRLVELGFTIEQALVICGGTYLVIRYGLSRAFKQFTVHRGMFHSLPAMFIAGLAVYLLYHHPQRSMRVYFAGGVMLGFLSHLVLDELYSVDFEGASLKLNKYAGTALKFFSPSWLATTITWLILIALVFLVVMET